MIFNWKGDGALMVMPIDVEQYKSTWLIKDKKAREEAIKVIEAPVNQVVIIPGWNEIDDSVWFLCRPHIIDKIDDGRIEEMVREEKDEKGNKTFVGVTILDFKNRQGAILSPEKLVAIIRGCNSVKTLEKWKLQESRDEIRLEIANQIEKLNKPYTPEE